MNKRILELPSKERRDEFLAAVKRSTRLHRPWVTPPATIRAFDEYIARLRNGGTHLGYWVITKDDELAGVINISEIVRGGFCSGYLGYYAFCPHDGQGYMSQGLRAVIVDAFGKHRLHRVEANVQPDNLASRALVERVGFRLEGFSPKYLKIAGKWRDHERWAMTKEDWKGKAAV